MADREKAEAVEEEYESDLDDAPLSALRRRDAASDDEGEEDDEDGGTPLRRRKAGSDADSEGQGAPEVYDEGAYEDGEEYEEYADEVYEEFGKRGVGGRGVASEAMVAAGQEDGEPGGEEIEKADEAAPGEEEEEKKGNEPYAVPTTGAFYMHDDRFQEGRGRGRGRQRF